MKRKLNLRKGKEDINIEIKNQGNKNINIEKLTKPKFDSLKKINNWQITTLIKRKENTNWQYRHKRGDFPCGPVGKNLPCNAGDMGLIPSPGRSHIPWSYKASVSQLRSPSSRAWEPQLLRPYAATAEAHLS